MANNWTQEQLNAINSKGANLLVAAAAGSGKTAVLVERIVKKVLVDNIDIDKMLVVTFTNAAAAEMKERILERLYKEIEENPKNVDLQRQIILLNKASISTIHSFCLEVIKNYFYEIDISPNFRIGDTTEIELLKQEVLEDLFEDLYEEKNEDLIQLVNIYGGYRGDEKLKEIILQIYRYIVNGVKIYGYKSKERQDIEPVHYPSIYRTGDELRFYEAYNDTVFCIEDGKLFPRWIFNTDKYHFPKELHGNVKESLDRIVVTYVTENDHLLFFQCAKGWFAGGKKVELCNAVLNKKDGTLLMNDRKKGFTDDLTNFMPFHPEDFTPKGEYIGALNVWDIQEWLEEHPDIKLEGTLAPLKDLADDANPVVVIVEPYK